MVEVVKLFGANLGGSQRVTWWTILGQEAIVVGLVGHCVHDEFNFGYLRGRVVVMM